MSDVKKPKTDADPTNEAAAEGEDDLDEEQLEAVSGGILIALNQPAAATAWKLLPDMPATLKPGDTAQKDLIIGPVDSAWKLNKK